MMANTRRRDRGSLAPESAPQERAAIRQGAVSGAGSARLNNRWR